MESVSEIWKQLTQKIVSSEDSRLDNLDETYTSFCRSPLHIAVMSGDIKFAKRILSKKPDLAFKQDSNGFTPLHLASVRTSLQMVRLLLKDEPGRASAVQDRDGRTPLHLAAMKNRVEIMKLLLEEGLPEAIHKKNNQNGETILHFCVKSNTNLKILKLLVYKLLHAPLPEKNPNPISINSTDNGGNTILHLAAKMGNMKITNYLLLNSNVRIDIHVVNNKRLKALNMLPQAEMNDLKFGFYDYHVRHDRRNSKTFSKSGDHEGMKDRVNTLMVVATLIAGIAFQAAMNPPGGVWQDDSTVDSGTDPVKFSYYLDHMYDSGSFISGGLERYIDLNLPSTLIFDSTGSQAQYFNIKNFVNALMNMGNTGYYDMMSKGLMLEDFWFADIVSNYRNRTGNISHVGFFPYLIRYAGYPILAYTYPDNYVIYMVTNGVALLVSLSIIFLVICGFLNETSVTQVRTLVVLMCISVGCIAFGYVSISQAMVPDFYTHVDMYLIIHIILGVCCVLGVGYFIWTLNWMIVKLRKRTRLHQIGVINYLKVVFFAIDSYAVGKLSLFIICYVGFRYNGYMYHGSWSHINPLFF
ncbi:hypothetical protein MKW98_012899 [Papaver atlanticum]|uniref:PGG domain-containing protein n=1 Tax=Papaver atlanticum TaxID=357466 RepID=A0AAD4XEC9_9MAGN|nr:hypothetical protein MKW98_012899 [Papaver atlanticum]